MISIADLKRLSVMVDKLLVQHEAPKDDHSRCVLALVLASDGHFSAQILLLHHKLYGSVFALLRVQIETTLRALWFRHCVGSEAAIDEYRQDKFPSISKCIQLLEMKLDLTASSFLSVIKRSLAALHSFTHGGSLQIQHHVTSEEIGPNFDPSTANKAIYLIAITACLNALTLSECVIAPNIEEFQKEVLAFSHHCNELVE